ncbi:MAG: hypothetical protein IPO70_15825 [Bacteroidetes bacterium]|nr:hypothetical protein [Bacteroidota bacterium]
MGGSVTTSTSVCAGSNSGVLTLSGHTGTVQKWQSSTNGGSNWNDISNTPHLILLQIYPLQPCIELLWLVVYVYQ